MDEFEHFVKIVKPDGTTREVPLGSWNELLAERVLDAGCTFELPKVAENSTRTWYGGDGIVKPKKLDVENSISDLSDSEIYDLLKCLDDEEMIKKHILIKESVENKFKASGFLDDRNRNNAEILIKRYSK